MTEELLFKLVIVMIAVFILAFLFFIYTVIEEIIRRRKIQKKTNESEKMKIMEEWIEILITKKIMEMLNDENVINKED